MENSFNKNIIPEDDEARVAALKYYNIIGSPPERSFDNIAALTARIFKVPVCLISLVDKDEVYFKANYGLGDTAASPRGISLCSLSILTPSVTVFEKADQDPCLLTNPDVAGSFGLRFYAGAPLTTSEGYRIGTLSVIDKRPRQFSPVEQEILEDLARVVMDEMELRRAAISDSEQRTADLRSIEALNEILETSNDNLKLSRHNNELINEELIAANKDFISANTEFAALNKELKETQEKLFTSNASLAESEEIKNLAIAQAEVAVWYVDPQTGNFKTSQRLSGFFGFPEGEEISYQATFEKIDPEYRTQITSEINTAIANGHPFELEFPLVVKKDEKQRWVRATGMQNPAQDGHKSYLSGTFTDITERKADDLRKSDFISMVSHELKTPLTSMNGYLQVLQLRTQKNGDEQSSGIINRALVQVRKMRSLIDGFLNMKRTQTGKIPLEISTFDMADLVKESESESQATITSHKVIFAPVEPTIVRADMNKIGQVITNFINNAVKYSPAGTAINVACVTIEGNAVVSVKDEGMGVAERDKPKLFERYFRAQRKETQTISGFGIGLYLCKEIIDAHHGKIGVESEVGNGSVFYFSLPLENLNL
ncbi:ATP-binding protein [Pedobacter jeongneungensis]|uniref:ATP-binding protein n=1 Tax=Pedobacter jeongneungensis TaxID=947309 RepID=UPI00046AB51E|nr:ATP-binding protein [Pedobacter jeongneungensis]